MFKTVLGAEAGFLGLGGAVSWGRGLAWPPQGVCLAALLVPARCLPLFLPASSNNQKCLQATSPGPRPQWRTAGSGHMRNPPYEENCKVDTVIRSRISTLLCSLEFHH